jgi:hypothetical protein
VELKERYLVENLGCKPAPAKYIGNDLKF